MVFRIQLLFDVCIQLSKCFQPTLVTLTMTPVNQLVNCSRHIFEICYACTFGLVLAVNIKTSLINELENDPK